MTLTLLRGGNIQIHGPRKQARGCLLKPTTTHGLHLLRTMEAPMSTSLERNHPSLSVLLKTNTSHYLFHDHEVFTDYEQHLHLNFKMKSRGFTIHLKSCSKKMGQI
ncbi:uncharacterized protein [Dasypus novemcinctus]|uniref:uncharacterized protein isoform X3 n=1 Tax=Dasypus novemcinctus TaxID=9361 RepID=UPI0039C9AAAD